MNKEIARDPLERCRLVLLMSAQAIEGVSVSQLEEIVQAGDVASLIFSPGDLSESVFQKLISPLVEAVQRQGIAAIVENDTRTAGRVGADGLQLGPAPEELAQAVEKFTPAMMVGACNIKTRHNALVIGELQPDYVMFGKPGGDIRPEPHPKNLSLGEWWSAMVEIPCIIPGGNDLKSVVDVARCGAEFVALGSAIFAPNQHDSLPDNPADRVREANRLLDKHAPSFETPDDE